MEEALDMYRQPVIGVALIETLDKMVASGMHSPELAMAVVVQFDKVAPSLPFHMLPLHCFLSQTHRSTTSIYLDWPSVRQSASRFKSWDWAVEFNTELSVCRNISSIKRRLAASGHPDDALAFANLHYSMRLPACAWRRVCYGTCGGGAAGLEELRHGREGAAFLLSCFVSLRWLAAQGATEEGAAAGRRGGRRRQRIWTAYKSGCGG